MVTRTIASQPGGVINSSVFTVCTDEAEVTTSDAYLALTGAWSTRVAEWATQQVIRRAGTIQNLFVHLETAPGGADTRTVTLRVNGVNTALTVTITGAAVSGNDVANEVAVVAGDLVDYLIEASATAVNSRVTVSSEYVAGTTDFATILYCSEDYEFGALTWYLAFMSHQWWWTTEVRVQQVIPRDGILRNLRVDLRTGPGAGDIATVTLRVNGANTALVVTIPPGSTSAENTANDVAVNAGDLVNYTFLIAGYTETHIMITTELH
jgi:hypothetical protein